ncbi:hypothetical protein [Chamaesiphon sp.]|uniref:hypothetical protein n=1 Tax=Chamaesiphon sp. TaxID=2814140 RepID=UPI00359396BF
MTVDSDRSIVPNEREICQLCNRSSLEIEDCNERARRGDRLLVILVAAFIPDRDLLIPLGSQLDLPQSPVRS